MNGISTAGPTCENRTSGSPNSASSAAMVRSQNIASSQPPPSACPCTEAITGFFSVHGVIRQRMLTASRSRYFNASCRHGRSWPAPPPTSKPTQKLRPSARSTITLVASSASARWRPDSIASRISIVSALSFSGRLSVTMPTLPSAA